MKTLFLYIWKKHIGWEWTSKFFSVVVLHLLRLGLYQNYLFKGAKEMKNLKWTILLMTGVLFITTTCIAYHLPAALKEGMYEFELTFLSNTIAGIIFLIGGIYGITKKKNLPQPLYLNIVIVLQVVFFICMAFISEFNFSGAFLFLHIINPIIATIEFFVFTSCKKMQSIKLILSALIFPVIYLIYAIAYGYISGNWLYGIINVQEKGIGFVSVLVLFVAVGILFLGWIQYKINFWLSQKRVH